MNDRKIIFKCRVGSHLYGLDRPDSDIDYFSIFLPNAEDLLGLQKREIVNNSTKSSSSDRRNDKDDTDDISYSLPRYLHLLLQNNPNIVETLFVNEKNIIILEPEFKYLMDNYERIVSQKIFHTFTGYAYAQKSKLIIKKERFTSLGISLTLFKNWAEKDINDYFKSNETTVQDFLDKIFQANKYWKDITESEAELLNKRLKYYKGDKHNCESFHKGMDMGMIYRKIRSEYEKYGWRVKTDSFALVGYDCKFAYHLIRLLAEGIELITTGKLVFPITGQPYSDILQVRNAELQYEELLELYKKYDNKIQSLKEKSVLRYSPDWNWANDWLINILKKHLRE